MKFSHKAPCVTSWRAGNDKKGMHEHLNYMWIVNRSTHSNANVIIIYYISKGPCFVAENE